MGLIRYAEWLHPQQNPSPPQFFLYISFGDFISVIAVDSDDFSPGCKPAWSEDYLE
ncbi:MAG: hypothetical protein Ct9H300mP2_2170 [Candidatus Neomarinimicrobiota bacterium]|nr:MAG: hypothetical protein Ct9H300mP2_2170 [Candidatus Neomarinimicrobiota bacterium]